MAVESKDGALPIRFALQEQKIRKTFRSLDEVEHFLQNEVAFWQAVTSDVGKNSILDGANYYQDFTGHAARAVSSFRRQKTEAVAVEVLTTLESSRSIIGAGKYGRLISECAATKPMAVPGLIFAIHSILNQHNNPRLPHEQNAVNFKTVASLAAGLDALSENRASGKQERLVLDQLISEFQEKLSEIAATKHEFETWSVEHRDQSETALETFNTDASKLLDETRKSLSSCLLESEGRVLELEKQVRERLILEAPTTYWKGKANKHYLAASLFGAVFLAIMFGGVYWLVAHGVEIITSASTELLKARPDSALLLLIPLVFITLPALAVAWVLRHVSRVVVQNLSLAADASLRGTIATTYSALTLDRDGTEAQLTLALQALLRPIDGNSHSEIAPPNLQDILELTRKSSPG